MYNELFSNVFYSTKHDPSHLTKEFNIDELLMIYSDGVTMTTIIRKLILNDGVINSDIKVPISKLICHRIHVIEQLSVVKKSLIELGFKEINVANKGYEMLYN